MAIITTADPLVEQLKSVAGKAEIVNGAIRHFNSNGGLASYAATRIAAALAQYAIQSDGIAFGGNAGFLCDLPNRRSFSPDAAFYVGPEIEMGFLPVPPLFAVEVRSENDYGRRAEREIAAKIADYFAAGTLVVWDVDLLHEEVVTKFSVQNPDEPQIFRRGDFAEAEPHLGGWRLEVNTLFPPRRA